MRGVQRIYVYGMAAVSLFAVTLGVVNLTGVILAPVVGLPFVPERFATWAGVLVVAFPLHLIHGMWVHRMAQENDEERRSGLRKAYEYGVATLGGLLFVLFAQRCLRAATFMALGGWFEDVRRWWLSLGTGVLNAGWGLLLVWYARVLLTSDGDLLQEGKERRWRQVTLLVIGLVALFLWLQGGTRAGQVMALVVLLPQRGVLTLGRWWAPPLSGAVASLLVGLGVWRWVWQRWVAWGEVTAEERYAVSRQLFFYTGLGAGVGLFLVGLGYLLRLGLLGILGVPPGDVWVWLPRSVWAAVAIPIGLGVAYVHWHSIQGESARIGGGEPLVVERLYMYVVSGVALAVLWWGGMTVIKALMVPLVTLPVGSTGAFRVWRQVLATGLALVLVAGPVWIWHWHRVERVARRKDEVGHKERLSLLRRVYVYGITFVSGVVVLIYSARVAYFVWLRILGFEIESVHEIVNVVGPALVSLGVWVYHLMVVVRDLRLERTRVEGGPRLESLLAERERLWGRIREIDEEIERLKGGGDVRPKSR